MKPKRQLHAIKEQNLKPFGEWSNDRVGLETTRGVW
jgi:hypothetical protein